MGKGQFSSEYYYIDAAKALIKGSMWNIEQAIASVSPKTHIQDCLDSAWKNLSLANHKVELAKKMLPPVAQEIEQGTSNSQAVGANPTRGTGVIQTPNKNKEENG